MADCPANVIKGNQSILFIRDDLDTEWFVIGGVKTRSSTGDAAVEDTTSSSTPGNFMESEPTGYIQETWNVSGVFDTRTGQTVNIGGVDYTVAATTALSKSFYENGSCNKFMLIAPYVTKEGFFNITSLESSGDTPGLENFSATMQNRSDLTIVFTP